MVTTYPPTDRSTTERTIQTLVNLLNQIIGKIQSSKKIGKKNAKKLADKAQNLVVKITGGAQEVPHERLQLDPPPEAEADEALGNLNRLKTKLQQINHELEEIGRLESQKRSCTFQKSS